MNEVPASSALDKDAPQANADGSVADGLDSGSSRPGSSRSGASGLPGLSGTQWTSSSGSVRLARSRQTWTGAGSAAGYVLRYLTPMRRLMLDIVGGEKECDRGLAILVAHLVKAGFSGHDQGRLRDFLVRGIRSAAKAAYDEAVTESRKHESLDLADNANTAARTPMPPKLDVAQLDSSSWIGYWREGILQRSWRSLERYQHARRYERVGNGPAEAELPREDVIHDVLRVTMTAPKETPESWASRVSALVGRKISVDELNSQIELGRIRFAQNIADEVAQTLESPDPLAIQAEIKTLGLGKAFAGVKVEA